MSLLDLRDRRLLLFGGKGGVGKTTCAAASALYAAAHGERTLIISTDPAHSLSDSLCQEVGAEAKAVKGVPDLYGLEVDPRKAMEGFAERYGDRIGDFLQPLAIPEIQGLHDYTLPGLDEALAFQKVIEFMSDPRFDKVIIDTAPTGHTLRLLSLPELLDSWIGTLMRIRLRLSNLVGRIRSLFGGGEEEDGALEMLDQMKSTIQEAREGLQDPERTTFVVVTIPEAMGIQETDRLMASLDAFEIPFSHIVVNMLIPEKAECAFCRSRRRMQERYLEEIRRRYSEYVVVEVPMFPHEVRGLNRLATFSEHLFK